MNGIEHQRRLQAALRRKWGEIWGADLDAEVPGVRMGCTIGELIDQVVVDTELTMLGAVTIEQWEEDT